MNIKKVNIFGTDIFYDLDHDKSSKEPRFWVEFLGKIYRFYNYSEAVCFVQDLLGWD